MLDTLRAAKKVLKQTISEWTDQDKFDDTEFVNLSSRFHEINNFLHVADLSLTHYMVAMKNYDDATCEVMKIFSSYYSNEKSSIATISADFQKALEFSRRTVSVPALVTLMEQQKAIKRLMRRAVRVDEDISKRKELLREYTDHAKKIENVHRDSEYHTKQLAKLNKCSSDLNDMTRLEGIHSYISISIFISPPISSPLL
jgi:hypothetical protein